MSGADGVGSGAGPSGASGGGGGADSGQAASAADAASQSVSSQQAEATDQAAAEAAKAADQANAAQAASAKAASTNAAVDPNAVEAVAADITAKNTSVPTTGPNAGRATVDTAGIAKDIDAIAATDPAKAAAVEKAVAVNLDAAAIGRLGQDQRAARDQAAISNQTQADAAMGRAEAKEAEAAAARAAVAQNQAALSTAHANRQAETRAAVRDTMTEALGRAPTDAEVADASRKASSWPGDTAPVATAPTATSSVRGGSAANPDRTAEGVEALTARSEYAHTTDGRGGSRTNAKVDASMVDVNDAVIGRTADGTVTMSTEALDFEATHENVENEDGTVSRSKASATVASQSFAHTRDNGDRAEVSGDLLSADAEAVAINTDDRTEYGFKASAAIASGAVDTEGTYSLGWMGLDGYSITIGAKAGGGLGGVGAEGSFHAEHNDETGRVGAGFSLGGMFGIGGSVGLSFSFGKDSPGV